jgi:hypothetical protein
MSILGEQRISCLHNILTEGKACQFFERRLFIFDIDNASDLVLFVVLSSGFPSDVVGRKLDSAVIVAFTPDQSAFAVRLDCELKYPFALTVSWNSLDIKGRSMWIDYQVPVLVF